MSVNQRFGINPDRTSHMGKLFHTIDFEMNESFREKEFLDKSRTAFCGTFHIGDKEFKLTINELKRLSETAELALTNMHKNYKLGGMRQ
jgi:hypothetical protein